MRARRRRHYVFVLLTSRTRTLAFPPRQRWRWSQRKRPRRRSLERVGKSDDGIGHIVQTGFADARPPPLGTWPPASRRRTCLCAWTWTRSVEKLVSRPRKTKRTKYVCDRDNNCTQIRRRRPDPTRRLPTSIVSFRGRPELRPQLVCLSRVYDPFRV